MGLLVSWGLAMQFATVATLRWLCGSLPHYCRLLTQPSLSKPDPCQSATSILIPSLLCQRSCLSLFFSYPPFCITGYKDSLKISPLILLHNWLQKNSITETLRMCVLEERSASSSSGMTLEPSGLDFSELVMQ